LKAYKEEHKNCLLPFNHKENESLANWVSNQRKCWKACTLSNIRVELLLKVGFVFDLHEKTDKINMMN